AALDGIRHCDSQAMNTLPLLLDLLGKEPDPAACRSLITTISLFGPAAASAIPQILMLRTKPGLCWTCPLKYVNGSSMPSLAETFYGALERIGTDSIPQLRPLLKGGGLATEEVRLLCHLLMTFGYASRILERDLAL